MSLNVNGNSNIDLRKLMGAKLNGKPGRTNAPKPGSPLSMTGSIFAKNAQMVSGQMQGAGVRQAPPNIPAAEVTTAKSIEGLEKTGKSGAP